MIAALRLEAAIPAPGPFDRAMSKEAGALRGVSSAATDFTNTISIGHRRQALFEALQNAVEQAQEVNWDGYGGLPADADAVLYALQFAEYLPTTIPLPDVAIDSDGEVVFEWDMGSRQTISVRVGRDGTVNYAGLVGRSAFHGVEVLFEGIPDTIARGIDRVVHATTI